MKLPAIVPKPAEIGKEALIEIGGALLAALIMAQLPSVKAYIKNAWA
ncbi:hypothetical protein [Rhodoferax sp.]